MRPSYPRILRRTARSNGQNTIKMVEGLSPQAIDLTLYFVRKQANAAMRID